MPDLRKPAAPGQSRGLEQRIVLRSGLSASEWAWERLRCPACGENSSKALHDSFVEGEQERFRLAHCDTCQWDWKVVSSFGPLSAPELVVADLASLDLDLVLEARRDGGGDDPGAAQPAADR